jgi:aryl-phospho-beta-D-glucosidase BglC (GH1 family)
MKIRHSLLASFILAITCLAAAQQPSIAFERVKHLRHGINASEWFSQHPSDYSAARTAKYTDDADLALMAKLGFDSVRLSIDPVPLEAAPLNPEGFNADFLARLDHVVDTILSHGMAVQIDIHPESAYKKSIATSDEAVDRFLNLWQRLATHYATRSPDLTFFEVMNEPELTDRARWALIQSRAVEVIRKAAPQHTIIVSGANWSSLPDFFALQPLADQNLIYNFHFYDPHTFTHQGAAWSTSWFRYTHDIPYPPTEAAMPAVLAQLPDAFSRYEAESYFLDHWDAHRIRMMIDAAADWGKANNVPLLCNEFGAYRAHTDKDSRLRWLHDVRTALEADNISWTMWDYRGGFGVVYKQDGYPAKIDEGVVEALGLSKQ